MPHLLNFCEAVETLAACLDDDDMYRRFSWVYASEDVPLHHARFYLSGDEDECEDPVEDALGREMPAFAAANKLVHYLEAATFVSVLTVQKEQQPLSSLDDFAEALKHYHEEDAFLDHGHFASDDWTAKARSSRASPGNCLPNTTCSWSSAPRIASAMPHAPPRRC